MKFFVDMKKLSLFFRVIYARTHAQGVNRGYSGSFWRSVRLSFHAYSK